MVVCLTYLGIVQKEARASFQNGKKLSFQEIDLHSLNQKMERNVFLINRSQREVWDNNVLVEVIGENYLRHEGSLGRKHYHFVPMQDRA